MSARDLLDTVWIVPALPLLGAVILLVLGKRIGEPKAGWIATGLLALAFVWSVVMLGAMLDLPDNARTNTVNLFTWFPAGALRVNIGFLTDPLSVTWILLVTGVGSLIHLYAIGYMHGDARFTRFFAYLNLFAASMLILVLGSSFLVTFLGWEGVGLCSYLLISHWFERNRAAVAGKKAFITNRVGDFGFMLAMFFIIGSVGSLDYGAMNLKAGSLPHTTVTAIALLLFVGCIGKSAQIPLHVWLPDAMEGPTPVSALIHAATMVTAGVYLLCRAHPFFEASGDAMTVVAWVGAGTALLAGTVALVQPDIKRVLAYSTVSQLGYMFLACGIGAYQAAVFMVIAHACYKGTLFLGAGSVIHGNEDNQDLRRMGGLRKFMPFTAFAFVLAFLAISGIPPLSGFFAKDEIISDAFYASDYALWIVAVVAAAITAIYMTRETLLTFFGNERFRAALGANPVEEAADGAGVVIEAAEAHAEPEHGAHEISPISPTVDYGTPPAPARLTEPPHEMPWTMVVPSLVLATLAVVIGFINLPFTNFEFLTDWLDPVFRGITVDGADSFVQGAALDVVTVTIAVAGIFFAWTVYRRGLPKPEEDPLDRRLGPIGRLFGNAYYFDGGISRLVDGPLRTAAHWLATGFDLGIIDGAVNGVARLVRGAATGLRKAQTGLVRQYAVGIVLGVVLLLLYALARTGF
ncbi:MAG: NADH-quinone oxidoreductase subunit L [Acidimicrobiia bacterium]